MYAPVQSVQQNGTNSQQDNGMPAANEVDSLGEPYEITVLMAGPKYIFVWFVMYICCLTVSRYETRSCACSAQSCCLLHIIEITATWR